jgi:hypothetical protein
MRPLTAARCGEIRVLVFIMDGYVMTWAACLENRVFLMLAKGAG